MAVLTFKCIAFFKITVCTEINFYGDCRGLYELFQLLSNIFVRNKYFGYKKLGLTQWAYYS